MKKIIYCICIIVLIYLISIIPTSAKEIKTCTRTNTNLNVPSDVKTDDLSAIFSTPCVDDIDKVYDFADLLNDNEEELLYNEVNQYIKNTNYDLALVTIDENPKRSVEEYADDFYDYNYFGKNGTRDGVLILIDMDNREMYISTSGYAIKMYDDYRIDRVLDSGYNYITNEDYYNTFSSMISDLSNYYRNDYPDSNKDLIIDDLGNPIFEKYIPYNLVFIISLIITVIVSLVLYFKSRLKLKVISVVSYLKNNEITLKNDNLVNTIVTHTRINTSSSSGGISSGSRSSSHTSSSGRSHGGGGRKF